MGVEPTDSPELRLRKSGLLLTAWSTSVLAIVWVVVYLALGRPWAAAIPLSYQVITLASIAWVARRGWTDRFTTSQIVIVLLLPALLMWCLGSFISDRWTRTC